MEKIYSKKYPKKLLHIVVRLKNISGRKFVSDPSDLLQVSPQKFSELGKICEPHLHLSKKINLKKSITQEMWVVIKGKIKIKYYDVNKNYICYKILSVGDCSLTLSGGHYFENLKKNSIAYEIKSGPYNGRLNDKIEF